MLITTKTLPIGQYHTFNQRPDIDLTKVRQVHSNIIAEYKGYPLQETEADGILFNYQAIKEKKQAISIITADCLPIIFLGKDKGCFIHAGWRGLQQSIHTHQKIKDIHPFYCYIGPSICSEHFEVQGDFDLFIRYPEFSISLKNRITFDLQAFAKNQIYDSFPGIRIEASELCTFSEQKLHSYRRSKTAQRNWNIFSV